MGTCLVAEAVTLVVTMGLTVTVKMTVTVMGCLLIGSVDDDGGGGHGLSHHGDCGFGDDHACAVNHGAVRVCPAETWTDHDPNDQTDRPHHERDDHHDHHPRLRNGMVAAHSCLLRWKRCRREHVDLLHAQTARLLIDL